MLTLLTIVCTVGMAQDETVWKSLSFPDDNKANNKCNNYTTTWTAKIGDDSWSVSNFNNNNWSEQNPPIWDHIRCGRNKNASVAAIVNDAAYTEAVTKVVVKIKTASSLDKVNSVRLITASDKKCNNIVETIDGSFGSNSTFTGDLTFNVTKPAKNLFYKFVIDIKKAGNNGIISINGVDYYISNSETSTPQPLPPLAPTPARHSHSPMASLRVLLRLQLPLQRATTTPTCLTLLNIQAMLQTS